MSTKVVKSEAGYSMVEVMVAILILAVAIIPMVGMFDAGLRAAVVGSNYDQARALANSNLEKVEAMSYQNASAVYKPVNAPTPGSPVSCDQGIYTCTVTTKYASLNSGSVAPDPSARTMMQVEVRVSWNNGGPYSTTGLKVK